MTDEPLIIKGVTAIPVSFKMGLTHFMYAKKLRKNGILIYNVHPLMDARSLFEFFKSFGEITSLRYSPPEAQAVFEFDTVECVNKILSTPLTKTYEFKLTDVHIPDRYSNQNPEWVKDYQKSKSDSETILQDYFRKRIESSKKPDDDGWITVTKGIRP
ncbi:unnamed protein product [Trichobilharzia szidati]|nr:unnamed protein product [Trichobilharzia szidati]